ncbi:MAG: LCP family protein [Clostridiales bacterium]|nr:LCP family protein [Clostridiales bacterium]
MSNSPKRKVKRQPPFLERLAKGLYITLFVLSLVVVVGYAALKIFAPKPTVDNQVVIPPRPVEVSAGPGETEDPDSSADPVPTPTPLVLTRREGVYTCLLLGVADQGGSDTIMLGVFDTGAKTASLISIPRDTVVRSDGKYRKINALYSSGGAKATASAVSELLAVPVDYYVTVNTKAFREIVNEIGGVYFNVPVDMFYADPYGDLAIDIKAGYQLLDGRQAEGVVRCRNCYASADIGRAATQRAFLTALVKQTITPSNATKVTSLINTFSKYVKSSMPLNDMVWFGTQAIGMDLDTALDTGALEGKWVSPYWQLDDQAALDLVNGLGIYQEEVPAEALHIVHP